MMMISDSQDNVPVTLNGQAQIADTNINTSPQTSIESVNSILPKKNQGMRSNRKYKQESSKKKSTYAISWERLKRK